MTNALITALFVLVIGGAAIWMILKDRSKEYFDKRYKK